MIDTKAILEFSPQLRRELLHTYSPETLSEWCEYLNSCSLRPPDYSDSGNAEIFVFQNEVNLIFTDSLGWLCWNGQMWERDDHKSMRIAVELSERMLDEARREYRAALHVEANAKANEAEEEELKAAAAEVRKAKEFLSHAQSSRSATRLKNMLEIAKHSLVIKADKLDANPFDLNTPAGIIDLHNGVIHPHSRTAFCSQITAASPGDGGSKLWAEFLDTITQGDGSIKGFLQMVAGMTLIGTVLHEGIILAYGGGRNGKSTFFNSLGAAAGDYTGAIAVKILTTDRNNSGASLATLRGKRLVITGELEEHQRLSVAMLKQIASTDALVIEEKYRQPESVPPSHSVVLFTNHLPRVGSTDGGTWRRLLVVPFNATIPAQGGIANYGDVLAREAGPAIMSWAIEGAVNFTRNKYKLTVPEIVAEATDEYREREDWLNNFINERCAKDPNARVRASELYTAYREWAEDTGDFVRRLNDFTAGMEAAGYQNVRPQNKSTWLGVSLDSASIYRSRYSATG